MEHPLRRGHLGRVVRLFLGVEHLHCLPTPLLLPSLAPLLLSLLLLRQVYLAVLQVILDGFLGAGTGAHVLVPTRGLSNPRSGLRGRAALNGAFACLKTVRRQTLSLVETPFLLSLHLSDMISWLFLLLYFKFFFDCLFGFFGVLVILVLGRFNIAPAHSTYLQPCHCAHLE